ncbi:xylose ABC transporter ATP-binding protein [Clostridium saccharoperbutylacetonicum]|uniref:xylose ABC transporter ATP-binding protein n=1 Tax=Clostridium saccharoperbutylacetonicum TaxID=36745 RepID=UPI00098401A2|nr:xylose ABC transporter ATP-binding protein [Clostridium saccharoperbutylacetonicum]AQR94849.1 xylose import ATP-binding protein XylG [Clostridium saccharoperbutylacetonicum]NSB30690.1 D-xylose transport system ATP-binding protein [Clostridium saccharoperbutylacetonicum]
MSEYILEMKDIVKEFFGVKALDGVNLKVKKGEIHALCGENGAGKSTLMKVLSGEHPTGSYSGQIIFEGNELNQIGIKDSERVGIAIIHQELALIKQLSIAENIFLGNEIGEHGLVNFSEQLNKTNELLNRVKLNVSPLTRAGDLGIGHQQLVEIAKALSKNAKLLILDEPSASLSEGEVEVLMGILDDLRRDGVTCIYISHKLNEVTRICDNVTVIRDGSTIGQVSIKEIDQDKLVQMMVGREMKNLFPREDHEIGEEFFEVKNLNVFDPFNKSIKRVKDANFTLRRGEILGISGLVGSGRTEMVASIYGSFQGVNNGEIYLEGKKVNIKNPSEALSKGIAMVPEDRKKDGIIAGMSVAKNMTMSNLLKYKKGLNVIDNDKEMMDVLKLIEDIKIKTATTELAIKNLSGGNQQKVILAKNLLAEPQILILDEPTRGIDVGAKYEIYKLIFKLAKQGISIIMVSSELPEVLGISDRVLVMNEGEIKASLDNDGLTQEMIMKYSVGKKSENVDENHNEEIVSSIGGV